LKKQADSTSDDSSSSDEGDIEKYGSCSRLMKLLNLADDQFKMYEFDARIGLNGAKCLWMFPCIMDMKNKRFYVWMG